MAEPMKNEGYDYSDAADTAKNTGEDALRGDIDLAKRGRQWYNNAQAQQKAAEASRAAQSAGSTSAGSGAAGTGAANAGAAGSSAGTAGATGAGAGGAGAAGGAAVGGAEGGTGAAGTTVAGATGTGIAAAVGGPITLIIIVILIVVILIATFLSASTTSTPVSNASLTDTTFETYETTDPDTGETVTRLRVSTDTTENQKSLIQAAVDKITEKIKPSYDEAAANAVSNDTIIGLLNNRLTGLSGEDAFYSYGDASDVSKANTYDKDGNQRQFACDLTASDVTYDANSQTGTMDSDYCHITYSIGPGVEDEAQLMIAYAQSVTGLLGQYSSAVRENGAAVIGNDVESTPGYDSDALNAYLEEHSGDGTDISTLEQLYYANYGDEYTSIASDKFAQSLIDDAGTNPFFAAADPAKWVINSTEIQTKYAAKYTVSRLAEGTETIMTKDKNIGSPTYGLYVIPTTVPTSKWVEDETVQTGVWDSADARSSALKDSSDTRYNIKQSYEYLYEIMDASVPIYYDISPYKEDELDNVRAYIIANDWNSESSDATEEEVTEYVNAATNESMTNYWASYVSTYIDFTGIADRLKPYFGEISSETMYTGANRDVISALSYGYDGTYSGPSISIIAGSNGGSGSTDYAVTGDWATIQSYCAQHGLYFMNHQCTDFVRYSVHQMYGIVSHGNGNEVAGYLVSDHPDMFVLSSTPAPGAVISIVHTSDDKSSPGYIYGHTAIVLSVDLDNDSMTIAEGNYGTAHAIVTRTVSISGYYPGLVTYAVPIQ